MSAIYVLWRRSSAAPISELARRMAAAQQVYGRDRSFVFEDQQVALGGAHLHLLPEDRFDRQPLWAPDRSCCLVADVRLDNRTDLIRELNLTQPELLADSFILLEAWLRWGSSCLDHIVGAFAFAVWTPSLQEIFAARDHVGERPLLYSHTSDGLTVASMPAGMRALGLASEPNELRIADWMALTNPDWTASFYTGIPRLPQGHFLRFTPDSFEVQSYWHPCDAKPIRFRRDSDYAEAFVEVLGRATLPRLRSVGGIGCQLSAGLDSSTIMASAATLLQREGRRITAFTYVPQPGFLGKGLPGRLVYEAPGAAEAAAHLSNVDHVLVDSSAQDLLADTKSWTDAAGELAANSINMAWISAILEAALDRGVRVLLQGVFGNFTFSQEGRDVMQDDLRNGRWIKLLRHANSLRNHGDTSFKASMLHAVNGLLPAALNRRLRPAIAEMHLDYSSLHPELALKYNLLERAFRHVYGDYPSLREQRSQFFRRGDMGSLNSAIRARTGVDPRDPSGDKRVFEFCYGIPAEQYVVGRQSRSLVRRAMQGRLPQSTLTRYKRGQQGVDWYLTIERALPSFREELALQKQSPLARRIVDLPRVERLLDTWPEIGPGSGHEGHYANDHWNYALTRGIALGYFLRTLES